MGVKTCINRAHVQVTLNSRIETVAVSLSGSTGTFVVFAAYSPPMTSDYRWRHSNWCEFLDCMEHHGKLHPVFVLGDMKLPQTDWSSYSSPDPDEQEILDELDKPNLSQLVNFKTTSTKCLDLVLANHEECVLNVFKDESLTRLYSIDDRLCSDHCAVEIRLTLPVLGAMSTKTQIYSFAMADYEMLSQLIFENPFKVRCWSNSDVLLN